ncbi:hypothetical protein [Pseudorhodoferax sp.]|uniref:hypothetical protein n=1 Tax=Pseudorhodoferax sp. TaxID=1993553 RepID=UPI002DD62BDA|nr:hypothetical protein [Pseudorhodoferax sp.]
MKTQHTALSELAPVRVLAALLERLEHSAVPVDPAQYQAVVARLQSALQATKPSDALRDLLAEHPAASELYENTQYEVAGLCRSPLDASVAAEQTARTVIQRAMQIPRESSANGQS